MMRDQVPLTPGPHGPAIRVKCRCGDSTAFWYTEMQNVVDGKVKNLNGWRLVVGKWHCPRCADRLPVPR